MSIHEALEAYYFYLALCEFEDTLYKESLYVHSQAQKFLYRDVGEYR